MVSIYNVHVYVNIRLDIREVVGSEDLADCTPYNDGQINIGTLSTSAIIGTQTGLLGTR